jgi:hypothetical protein
MPISKPGSKPPTRTKSSDASKPATKTVQTGGKGKGQNISKPADPTPATKNIKMGGNGKGQNTQKPATSPKGGAPKSGGGFKVANKKVSSQKPGPKKVTGKGGKKK